MIHKAVAAQRQFYRDLQKWIAAGMPSDSHYLFSAVQGLCENYFRWCSTRKVKARSLSSEFEQAGLRRTFPFNNGSAKEFNTERGKRYKNPLRLKWVKDHCK